MSKKKKYYVVWHGVNPGIYENWEECKLQIKGFKGAIYKSFNSKEEASEAYSSPPKIATPIKDVKSADPIFTPLHGDILENSISVDAACSGNPGPMEYRAVYTATGQELFKFGPIWGTNNIGEFLALVHGLAYLKQKGWDMPIYTDSVNAMKWVKNRKCKTKLAADPRSAKASELIMRAEQWLIKNSYTTKIIKWDTKDWGEIPADFGRK